MVDLSSPKRVTLREVADRAGVSQATASRVLGRSTRDVSSPARQAVLRAARDLGYITSRPNVHADAASRTLVLIVGDLRGAYFATLASHLIRKTATIGWQVSIVTTERDPIRELQAVRESRAHDVAAVVFAGSARRVEPAAELLHEIAEYARSGRRVLAVGRENLPVDTVDFDGWGGARSLGVELANLGYRRPLILRAALPLAGLSVRVDGFIDGFGARPSRVVEAGMSWADARAAIRALPPEVLAGCDLLFAVTDEMAMGALAGLRSRGLRVPDDVAVAGFNDLPTLRDVAPPLTSVHVPLDLLADAVVAAVADPDAPPRVRLATYPIVRGSTPPLVE